MSRWFTLAVLALGAGCSHQVYSPPSRLTPLQSPATAGEGRAAVAGAVAGGGELFGPEYLGGEGRLRYGLTPTLELDGTATVVEVEGAPAAADPHPFIYAGRAGLKWTPAAVGRYLALTAGLGGGWSAGGGFVAPDAGLVLGLENPYFVPFLAAEALLSVPIDPRPVDTSSAEDGAGTHVDTPELTYGARGTLGARVPLTFGTGHHGSFYLAASLLSLWDAGPDDALFSGVSGAFELNF